MMHFFKFCKTIIPNYRLSKIKTKEIEGLRSVQEKYTLTSEDYQKLMALSQKRSEADKELIKFWKKVGDKMNFDYRTARGAHPFASPELVAIPLAKEEKINDPLLKPA